MRIKVNDTEYSVSMKWNADDTIQHFVLIDDELHELDIPSRMNNDGKTYITSAQFREILAQHIQDTLNNRPSNGRA